MDYDPLASVYGFMLGKGKLPSEVDEEDPIMLLDAIAALTDGMEEVDEDALGDPVGIHPMLWNEAM